MEVPAVSSVERGRTARDPAPHGQCRSARSLLEAAAKPGAWQAFAPVLALATGLAMTWAGAALADGSTPGPLVIQEQGSFTVGGTVRTEPGAFNPAAPSPSGQTFRGDHAYVFYQKPVNAHALPLVMWHGAAQFSKSWETTADGREGFQTLFLRRNYSVYLIDQPRRGNAGRSTVPATITPVADEQAWFNIFRIGEWPDYFPGVQFARDPETLNQFFRSITPNTGPFDMKVISDAVSALFDKSGQGSSSPTPRAAVQVGSRRSGTRTSAPLSPSSQAAASCSRTVRCPLRCQAPLARWKQPASRWRSSCGSPICRS